MDTRNPSSAKKVAKLNKKKGVQGTKSVKQEVSDSKKTLKKTDPKNIESKVSEKVEVENHERLSLDSDNKVDATSSNDVKTKVIPQHLLQNTDCKTNMTVQESCSHVTTTSGTESKAALDKEGINKRDDSCHQTSNCVTVSTDEVDRAITVKSNCVTVSTDEVDRAITVKNDTRSNLANNSKNNSATKRPSNTSDKHISQHSCKTKQEILLAALEKSCMRSQDTDNSLCNQVHRESNATNSETQKRKSNAGENASEKTDSKTEKELRKLEWQKKNMEQNSKREKDDGLSKAELKAKRREQQEAQRLAKLAAKEPDVQKTTKPISRPPVNKESSPIKQLQKKKSSDRENSTDTTLTSKDVGVKSSHKSPTKTVVRKFALSNVTSHLFNPTTRTISSDDRLVNFSGVHPEFIKLGVKVSSKIVMGSNARCLAMLSAIRQLVSDLQTPPKQDFCRYLESVLQKSIDHLDSCRPLSVCMKNALKYFKSQLTDLTISASEKEKKDELVGVIGTYIHEEIETAAEGIVMEANSKITDGDVILTFGCSSLVEKVLLKAMDTRKNFEVIVVDSRPLLEGREMLRRLVVAGVQCKYVLINALSHVMNSVSLVFLGAHALLSNGYIMSRIGTAQVALVAKTFNKPVIVCSEAYKLSDLVQSDAFVYNELGDPRDLINANSPLSPWKTNNRISVVNLLYDFTPPDFVRAVITELGSFHGKSVTSIRRKKPKTLL